MFIVFSGCSLVVAEDEGHWIVGRGVKYEDPDWTKRSEGCVLGLLW